MNPVDFLLYTTDLAGDEGEIFVQCSKPELVDDDYQSEVIVRGSGIDLQTLCFGVDPIQTMLIGILFIVIEIKKFEDNGGVISLLPSRDEPYSTNVWLVAARAIAGERNEH